jgi:hypothetical protein
MSASGLKKLNNFPYAKVSRKKIQIYHRCLLVIAFIYSRRPGMVVCFVGKAKSKFNRSPFE